MRCPSCHALLEGTAAGCCFCGAPLGGPSAPSAPRRLAREILAVSVPNLLAFPLGWALGWIALQLLGPGVGYPIPESVVAGLCALVLCLVGQTPLGVAAFLVAGGALVARHPLYGLEGKSATSETAFNYLLPGLLLLVVGGCFAARLRKPAARRPPSLAALVLLAGGALIPTLPRLRGATVDAAVRRHERAYAERRDRAAATLRTIDGGARASGAPLAPPPEYHGPRPGNTAIVPWEDLVIGDGRIDDDLYLRDAFAIGVRRAAEYERPRLEDLVRDGASTDAALVRGLGARYLAVYRDLGSYRSRRASAESAAESGLEIYLLD